MASAERPSVSTDGSAPRSKPDPAAGNGVALDQLFDAEGLFQLRSAVAAHGAHLGLAEPDLADLVLVAHELASNAVRHGGADSADPGRLRLWRDGDLIVCEVSDHGPGLADPDRAGEAPSPSAASGGRGLYIVRQVVRQLEIASGPGGATVTATVAIPEPEDPVA
jgi:anti-sigma regulatory factor (Ser/Thr protein kinase)